MTFEEWWEKEGLQMDRGALPRREVAEAAWQAAQWQWQPIDTAPRDGTYVHLAHIRNGLVFVASGRYNKYGHWLWPVGFPEPNYWMPLEARND